MARLDDKVAIVTGASKGIGAAIAEKLAEEGAVVVVNYASSDSNAEKVVARITARGGRAKAMKADVRKQADIRRLFDSAVKEFGKVDVLVNNAGYTSPVRWQPSMLFILTVSLT
jgi:3-oxoacyl-[acyl-carrier protein] reductase